MPVKRNIPSQRKPRKKTPDQIINDQIKPYEDLGIGNPNPIIEHNRAEDVSVKNDVNKEFTIALEDFYAAIKYYITQHIKPTILENNKEIPVPVEYAFPERWNAAQKEGYLRDKDGRVLLPVIALRRTNITRNRDLGNKLDGNKVHNFQTFQTQYNRKNIYDNFSVLTNRIPVKQYWVAPVPDYVIVTYTCSIFCNMQQDMDRILQSFIFAADSYWGQYHRFRFKVTIAEFTDTIEYTQGEDRSVRSDFNIVLNGYLLPDSVNRDIAIQKKILSKAVLKFNFNLEGVSNVTRRPPQIITSDLLVTNGIYLMNSNGLRLNIGPQITQQQYNNFLSSPGNYWINGNGNIIGV